MKLSTLLPSGASIYVTYATNVPAVDTNISGSWRTIFDAEIVAAFQSIRKSSNDVDYFNVYNQFSADWMTRTNGYIKSASDKETYFNTYMVGAPGACPSDTTQENSADEPAEPDDVKIRVTRTQACQALMNFMSEFEFSIGARFVNTLALQPCESAGRNYLVNYCKLTGNPDIKNVEAKTRSDEFSKVFAGLTTYPPQKQVNQRFECAFGEAGTGKTQSAISQYPNAPVVVCTASMLPSDLIKVFDFNDENGHPVFKPAPLREAMENGYPIILDEINLLSFDCLRTLQCITDAKTDVNIEGVNIHIADGFKIVGTMNLLIDGQIFSLPKPLVDRAYQLTEATLSANALADYAF